MKPRTKNNKILLFLAVVLACVSALNVNAESKYVPGEIIVEFLNTTTEQQVRNVISSRHLQWKESSPVFVQTSAFRMYVQVPQEVIADFSKRDTLSKDIVNKDKEINVDKPILVSAWPTSFTYVEKYGGTVLVILFNNTATEVGARNLIGAFKDLKIVDMIPENSTSATIHVWGVVKVPVGEEQSWITTLKTEPLVKSAELNFITEVANDNVVVPPTPTKKPTPVVPNVEPTTRSENPSPPTTPVPITPDTEPYTPNGKSLVALVIAGVGVIGLVIFLVVRRQRKT